MDDQGDVLANLHRGSRAEGGGVEVVESGQVVNTVIGDVVGISLQAGHIEGDVHLHHHAAARPKADLPHRAGAVPPLAASFRRRSAMIGGTPRTTVLSGMGGVGKTQLAVDHAERAWAAGEVELLVWITAGSRDAVVSGYARVAADVTGIEDAEPHDGARRFLDWLTTTSARWLVVLDGVQSPGDLVDLWPPTAPTGRVLVTTRRRDTALHGHGRGVVEVGTFTEEEALAYLTGVVGGRPHLLDGATELVTALGRLPLALAQSAAYLLDRDLSCAAYLERLADRRRLLAAVLPEGEALPDSHRATVAATWSMSVEHADRLEPAGMAGPLLDVAAMLSADGIPVEVFTTPAVVTHLSDRVGRVVEAEEARDGLGCLHRLSLVTLDGPVVRVHALVQRVTRDGLASRLPIVARVAASALVHVWPEVELDTVFSQVLRANAEALAAGSGDHLWHEDAHEVLLTAATSLGKSGLVADAADRFRHLCAEAEDHLGPDHAGTLAARAEAAQWQGETGDSAGAVRALEELLADRARILGDDDPDVLVTRNDLALWRARAGDPAGAVQAFEALLADQMRLLGADHHSTLVTRGNFATWLEHTGDSARAFAAFEELLADQVRVLGADHPVTLTTRVNLASGRAEEGEASETLTEFEALLPDLERVFGADHPTTLASRQAFASALGKTGDPAGAVSAFENVLVDQLRVLGPDHPYTLITRHDIAFWTGQAGDPVGAVRALEGLLLDQLRLLGPEHPHTLAGRHALASMLGEAGDPDGALAAFEELLQDQTRVFGPDNQMTLDIRGLIALWRKETGDLAGAVAALEVLHFDQRRVLGPDHATTLVARAGIAAWRAEMGDFAGAVGWAEALLHDRMRLLDDDDPDIVSSHRTIAHWRRQAGDEAGLLAVLERLLPYQVRALGADHPDALSTRLAIGYGRGEAGDVTGALSVLDELLPDLVRTLGAEHDDTEATRGLIDLYRGRMTS